MLHSTSPWADRVPLLYQISSVVAVAARVEGQENRKASVLLDAIIEYLLFISGS